MNPVPTVPRKKKNIPTDNHLKNQRYFRSVFKLNAQTLRKPEKKKTTNVVTVDHFFNFYD